MNKRLLTIRLVTLALLAFGVVSLRLQFAANLEPLTLATTWVGLSLAYLAWAHAGTVRPFTCCFTILAAAMRSTLTISVVLVGLTSISDLGAVSDVDLLVLAQNPIWLSVRLLPMVYLAIWIGFLGNRFRVPDEHLVDRNGEPLFPGRTFRAGPFRYPDRLLLAHPNQALLPLTVKVFSNEGSMRVTLEPHVSLNVAAAERLPLEHIDLDAVYEGVRQALAHVLLREPEAFTFLRTLKQLPLGERAIVVSDVAVTVVRVDVSFHLA